MPDQPRKPIVIAELCRIALPARTIVVDEVYGARSWRDVQITNDRGEGRVPQRITIPGVSIELLVEVLEGFLERRAKFKRHHDAHVAATYGNGAQAAPVRARGGDHGR